MGSSASVSQNTSSPTSKRNSENIRSSKPVSVISSPTNSTTSSQQSKTSGLSTSSSSPAPSAKPEASPSHIRGHEAPDNNLVDRGVYAQLDQLKKENEKMKKEIKSLQEDNRLLRVQKSAGVSQDFLVGPPRTVQVPPQFEHIFKKAESEVAHYFSQKVEEPRSATISIMQDRFIIMRGPAISLEFKNVIQNMLGDAKEKEALELARHILYDLAYGIGRADCESFCSKMVITDPLVLLAAGTIQFSFRGWGFVNISEASNPVPIAEQFYLLYDHPFSFESSAYIQAGEKISLPICVMNAGYSAGWCSVAFKLDLYAVEILCKAKGDPCCRFIMCNQSCLVDRVRKYQEQHKDLAVHDCSVLPGYIRNEHQIHKRAVEAEKIAHELQKKVESLTAEKEEIFNKVTGLYT